MPFISGAFTEMSLCQSEYKSSFNTLCLGYSILNVHAGMYV